MESIWRRARAHSWITYGAGLTEDDNGGDNFPYPGDVEAEAQVLDYLEDV